MKVALTGHRPQRLGLPEDETNKEWWQMGAIIYLPKLEPV